MERFTTTATQTVPVTACRPDPRRRRVDRHGEEDNRSASRKMRRRRGGRRSGSSHVLANGSIRTHDGGLTRRLKREVPREEHPEAGAEERKRRKKLRRKKRRHVAIEVAPRFANALPKGVENWEEEVRDIFEARLKRSNAVKEPYDPEDMLSLAFRNWSLAPATTTAAATLPLPANYSSPAALHPPPFCWTRPRVPVEDGQFADADE